MPRPRPALRPTPPAAALLAAALALLTNAAAAEAAPDVPEARFEAPDMREVRLGRLLFYDPILSGNRNVACADCHHPRFATSDGVSLGLGEGGVGLGPDRRVDPRNPPEQRVPRNAPALFNLGADQFRTMFHDGRVEADPSRPSGLRTPLGEEMVQGYAGVLSAQTMFPVLSPDEMAGHYGENEISTAVRKGRLSGPGGAWGLLARRVEAIPEYRAGFAEIRDDLAQGGALTFPQVSDAIAAFIAFEWRADDSPFDRHLRGEAALGGPAAEGMALFYGEAGCGTCHSGRFQTDHGFHAMGAPQIGPGKAERFERHAKDVGRMRVTGRAEDAYAFRTPSLRNVTRTGPWGHAGAHSDLRAFLRDHAAPGAAPYDRRGATLPPLEGAKDWRALEDPAERAAISAAVEIAPRSLSEAEIEALLAFLTALEDETSLSGRLGVPERVPSGLPVLR